MECEKVRVLVIVSQMNRGGLESRLMDIIRHIDFTRVQLDIFTYRMDSGIYDKEAKGYGCKIYYNPPLSVKNMFWYTNYFANFLREHPEYKIIHAHQDAWCSVFCRGAQKAGVPVRIAHSRTAVSTQNISDIIKNIIKLPTRKYATHMFAVSDLAGIWLFGKRNVENGTVKEWPNAIECSRYIYNSVVREEKRKELNIEQLKVILHVGNFTPPKNHEKIIRIFNEVLEQEKNAVLLLAGGGEDDLIRQTVQELNITDKVLFLGIRDDIPELLWAADVFLFPSIFEGMPGAVIEAQASGLPCVISDSITKEVCITSLVKQISLKQSDKFWAECLIDSWTEKRRNTLEDMQNAKYDITVLVKELMIFYENAVKY